MVAVYNLNMLLPELYPILYLPLEKYMFAKLFSMIISAFLYSSTLS